MDASIAAAWWGAAAGTVALVWDFFKWLTSGPHLRINARPNFEVLGTVPISPGKFVCVDVTNRGDAPTTLTHLAMIHFPNRWHRLRNTGANHYFVLPSIAKDPLPFLLAPGAVWQAAFEQDAKLDHLLENGLLYVYVNHSQSEKPCRTRCRTK